MSSGHIQHRNTANGRNRRPRPAPTAQHIPPSTPRPTIAAPHPAPHPTPSSTPTTSPASANTTPRPIHSQPHSPTTQQHPTDPAQPNRPAQANSIALPLPRRHPPFQGPRPESNDTPPPTQPTAPQLSAPQPIASQPTTPQPTTSHQPAPTISTISTAAHPTRIPPTHHNGHSPTPHTPYQQPTAGASFVVSASNPAPSPNGHINANINANINGHINAHTPASTPHAYEPPRPASDDPDDTANDPQRPQRDVRGDIGPLIDTLRAVFERNRAIASQGGVTRCGLCYLSFHLTDLQYRETEGYYVCGDCARALGPAHLPMVRRQRRDL